MRTYIYILLVIILFFSCTKNGKNISVEGIVYNPLTGKGISDVKVTLLRSGGGLPGGFVSVKSTATDANGHYAIDHLGGPASYYLQINTGRYDLGWTPQGGIGITGINKGETFYGNYETVGYTHGRLIIENTNCQGASDSIIVYQANQIGTFDGDYAWLHTGCVYWESVQYSKFPMGNVYYRWEVTRSGVTEVFYDTVFYDENEYKTYTITY